MRKIVRSAFALGALLVPALPAAPALAQPKTYVSNTGNDFNSCVIVGAACATFAGALAKTNPGGEITVLNIGEYGPVVINKSINITNDGAGEASILAPASGVGIDINAGVGDIISLRGLVIDGQGVGNIGIFIEQASAVHIQNCVIRNFEQDSAHGLFASSSHNMKLFVSDTLIFNNGRGVASGGIVIVPLGTATAGAVLDRVRLENNVIGLRVAGGSSTGNGAHAVLRDSVVSGNASHGISATSSLGQAPALIAVERTSSVNNAGTGIIAVGPHAVVLLHDNTVARNGVGISATATGQLISYGNNKVNNNLGADGVPTGSYSPI